MRVSYLHFRALLQSAFLLTFVAAQGVLADKVVVTSDHAELRVGKNVIGSVEKGNTLNVLRTQDGWFLVRDEKTQQNGWLHPNSVRLVAQVSRGTSDQELESRLHDAYDEGRLDECLQLAQRLLQMRRTTLGEAHEDTGTAYYYLGLLNEDRTDFAAAEKNYRKALGVRERALGKDHLDTAECHMLLGELFVRQQNHVAALPHLTKGLEIRKKQLGMESLETALSLSSLGVLHNDNEDYKQARPYLEQALAILQRVVEKDDPDLGSVHGDLGLLLTNIGEYDAAQKHLQERLRIYELNYGGKDLDTAWALDDLGYLLAERGQFTQAKPLYERALAIRVALLGEEDAQTAESYFSLADLHYRMDQLEQCRALMQKSLDIRLKVLGPNSYEVGSTMSSLGECLLAMGEHYEAGQLFEKALKVSHKIYGDAHPDTAYCLGAIGRWHKVTGEYSEANRYFEKALAILNEAHGEGSFNTTDALDDMGAISELLGDLNAARAYYSKGLEIRKKALGPEHPLTAYSMESLGRLCIWLGEYAEARPLLEEALRINKKALGEEHSDTGSTISSLSLLMTSIGNYERARELIEQAVAIYEKSLGEDHPDTANLLNTLGFQLIDMEEHDAARECLERALQIQKKSLGDSHPDITWTLNNIAQIHEANGDYESARANYEQTLAIRQKVFGERNVDTAWALLQLGNLLKVQGDHAAARKALEGAVNVFRGTVGADHPDTGIAIASLAELEVAVENWDVATELFHSERRIDRRHVVKVLPALTEKEQLKFIKSSSASYETSLSFALKRADDSRVASLSSAWLVNGKAVAQEAMAERSLLAQPETADMVRQLQSVRSQLSTLALRVPTSENEQAHREKVASLESQQQELLRRLGDVGAGIAVEEPWVSTGKIRDELPGTAVMVNIARFEPYDFDADEWQSARYVAWVIPATGRGSIQIVDLGDAEAIDTTVAAARAAMANSPAAIRDQGEPKAKQLVTEPLQKLASQIVAPLEKHLEKSKVLILSPDASLWLVPWGALPMDDGRYLIEAFEIRYSVSGREIARRKTRRSDVRSAVIMADPDFDLAPTRSTSDVASRDSSESVPLRSLGSFDGLQSVSRLRGTAAEAAAIRPALESFTRSPTTVYTDAAALESVYKSLYRPRVLVLSTHGFFLEVTKPDTDEKQRNAQGNRGESSTVGHRIDNPLLRCGLLLAGFNERDKALNLGAEDGVLTGLEIVGTDLRGTELVVLSACETGIGDVTSGEGVAGLRQAFQLAGAESVVSTLWQIPDRETARLMSEFFNNLAAGMNKTAALREAQLTRIASRRDRYGAAHPLYWAAFTLTGQ